MVGQIWSMDYRVPTPILDIGCPSSSSSWVTPPSTIALRNHKGRVA